MRARFSCYDFVITSLVVWRFIALFDSGAFADMAGVGAWWRRLGLVGPLRDSTLGGLDASFGLVQPDPIAVLQDDKNPLGGLSLPFAPSGYGEGHGYPWLVSSACVAEV